MDQHANTVASSLPEALIPLKNLSATVDVAQEPEDFSQRKRRHWPSSPAWSWLFRCIQVMLVCLGGPIALYYLPTTYLQFGALNGYPITLPCDLHPIWSSWSTLFEINYRTGDMSFTTAKLLDVAFDLFVGRGGQLVLAWQSGRVYRGALTRLAEDFGIDVRLFVGLALDPHGLRTVARAPALGRRSKIWRVTAFTTSMSLTALYVIVFPTLISAATSFVAPTKRGVLLPDNDTVSLDKLEASAAYMLKSTGVKSVPDRWILPVKNISRVPQAVSQPCLCLKYWDVSKETIDSTLHTELDNSMRLEDGMTYNVSAETEVSCGFYINEIWLPADVEALTQVNSDSFRQRQRQRSLGRQLKHLSPVCNSYTLYERLLVCVPDGLYYQWGASYEMLMVILVLFIVWAIVLFYMAVDTWDHGTLSRHGWQLGEWRTLVDVGTLLGDTLGRNGVETTPEKGLEEVVKHHSLVKYNYEINGDELAVRLRAS